MGKKLEKISCKLDPVGEKLKNVPDQIDQLKIPNKFQI